MISGKMLKMCTEIDTFIKNHGVESYKEQFRPDLSLKELLKDHMIYESNEYYEKYNGPGITEHDVAAFIEYWGVKQYKEWCARDKTYDSIISNELFATAEQKFLEKKLSTATIIREYKLALNPYRREFRDHKGDPVPEPPTFPQIVNFYDMSYSIYIQNNGIINYMIKTRTTNTLEELLNYQDVAHWQKSYIHKLEYENKLL